jgi:hypothetical protein
MAPDHSGRGAAAASGCHSHEPVSGRRPARLTHGRGPLPLNPGPLHPQRRRGRSGRGDGQPARPALHPRAAAEAHQPRLRPGWHEPAASWRTHQAPGSQDGPHPTPRMGRELAAAASRAPRSSCEEAPPPGSFSPSNRDPCSCLQARQGARKRRGFTSHAWQHKQYMAAQAMCTLCRHGRAQGPQI